MDEFKPMLFLAKGHEEVEMVCSKKPNSYCLSAWLREQSLTPVSTLKFRKNLDSDLRVRSPVSFV